jgi:spermidine/putrescine transport system permease protein
MGHRGLTPLSQGKDIMKQFKNLVKPYLIWSFILIVVPLFLIVMYSVTTGGNSLVNIQFTGDNFKKIFEPVYMNVFIRSFKLGAITTIVCLVIGYMLAYVISRYSEKAQNILILAVTIPTWINMLLRTYAWISLLSDNGIINSLFTLLGLDPVTMMYTDFSVIIGLVCDLLPFMVIPIHTSLAKMDHSLIEAAYDLGAKPLTAFWKVTFKLSIPGVVNGTIMVFLLSISSFVIPKLLGGGQYVLIGNLIEEQFISVGDWNFGSAISMLLAVAILIMIRIMKKIDPDENGGA